MRGADAAFLMATPFIADGTEAEVRHGTNLVDAAVAAGHVVYSSVASADLGTGVPHFESKHAVERHLASAGAAWTVVAPTEFLDMVLAPWSLPALREGVIGVPVPGSAPRQLTVVADVAAFAGLVLEQPERFAGRRIEIASDVVTGDELATALARVTGRDISYVMPSPDAAVDADLQAMYAFMESGGYSVDVAPAPQNPSLRSCRGSRCQSLATVTCRSRYTWVSSSASICARAVAPMARSRAPFGPITIAFWLSRSTYRYACTSSSGRSAGRSSRGSISSTRAAPPPTPWPTSPRPGSPRTRP
jgi:hypothetical protein